MSSSNLIRWSGLAALAGAVLLVVFDGLEFALLAGKPESETAATSAWIIVHGSILFGVVLAFLGLVGLYARQAEQAGTLGLVAFLVAFIGMVMLSGMQWSTVVFGPYLAEAAPGVMDAEPPGAAIAWFMGTLVLFALGWLLLGLASLRVRVLPRRAAALLMAGAVLFFVLILLDLPGYSIVLGVGLAWMGYALWSGTHEQVGQPERGS